MKHDKDKSKMKGLTPAQKKLPKKLQEEIMKKKKGGMTKTKPKPMTKKPTKKPMMKNGKPMRKGLGY